MRPNKIGPTWQRPGRASRPTQAALDPRKLIFVDETRFSTKVGPRSWPMPEGKRLIGKAPFGHWNTTTFTAGVRFDGVVAPFVLDGPMNGEAFLAYVEEVLAPSLSGGDMVVIDSLPAHKVQRRFLRPSRRGCEAHLSASLFARSQSHRDGLCQTQGTPASSSRLSCVKPRERTRRALWNRIGQLLDKCTPQECATTASLPQVARRANRGML